jgi:hypothetical protein
MFKLFLLVNITFPHHLLLLPFHLYLFFGGLLYDCNIWLSGPLARKKARELIEKDPIYKDEQH